MIRVDKPNGDFFYAVPYDTDEISYLVKIDVKIDDLSEDERRRSITTTRSRAPTTSRRRAPRRRRRRTTTWKSDGRCCRCATRLSERTVGFFIAAADGVPNGCAPCGRAARFRRQEPPRTRMEADRLFRPLLCRERGLRVPSAKRRQLRILDNLLKSPAAGLGISENNSYL